MTIRRRTVLAAGASLAAAPNVLQGSASSASAQTQTPPDQAVNTARAPFRQPTYLRLPPGAVTAHGWLATQLDKQLNGLNGRLEQISHFLRFDRSGWVHPNNAGWEEVPYWLRGFGDLGYVTGDARVLRDTERWIGAVLATQAADGFFGPGELRSSLNGHADFWPHMPMLHALRSWAEYCHDDRVITVLTRFFSFMTRQPDAVFSDGWGATRWGDMLDVIAWLHERTGDPALVDLTHRIHRHSANWSGPLPTLHNVNIAQGFREPAQYWLLSGDSAHREATYRAYDTVMRDYGQFPGGGFAGDENARPGFGDPRQGFETCGVVEYMASHELLGRITGDAVWADRAEDLAFNLLPAALDPSGKVTHYVTPANVMRLDDVTKRRRQFQNGFAMLAYKPGVDEYRCCPHNYGQGWPYFVEEMWWATHDGGLVAAHYGPCRVTTTVAGGVAITINEDTTYPFGETITFRVQPAQSVEFPLILRVPRWCQQASATVNGQAVTISATGGFTMIRRRWAPGDVLVLSLPMTASLKTWTVNHSAVSVEQGPLTYSLRIDERWNRYAGTADWPELEVTAGSSWNVALDAGTPLTVSRSGGDLNDPFSTTNAPVRITARVRDLPDWTADSEQVIGTLNDSPVWTAAPSRQATLIPAGAARLRITAFPRSGGTRGWGTPGVLVRVRNFNSGKVLAVDAMSTADSANVVQVFDTGTAEHLWRFVDVGNGQVKLRNEHSGKVLGVDQMSTSDSAQVVQYNDNGTRDHLWELVDNNDGRFRLRNVHSGKVLGVDQMSTADSARVVQFADNGTRDHLWQMVPDGIVKIQNLNSGKVLGVDQMSTADSARVVQFADNGTRDHLWQFVPDSDGYFRIRNSNSNKVLGVNQMSTADSARVVQFADNGTADHLWRLRPDTDGLWRLQNKNSSKVLAVDGMSYADSAQVVQFSDTRTPDHLWRLLPG
ncbi:hypothetical protein GCM10011609_88070 [Lentzea pudingi]|uniref:Ricin B lectin domain-containing protein n=1 Tax=Lentzea pudingi TaxID=1789439 RepID=A0ABQ2IX93_9PSEU|nr:RICIN domain-containing protein [Lentzea pudingi]GGN30330.1 hypothetical protein GCM10011609_88070 [Lentzea pudingi]